VDRAGDDFCFERLLQNAASHVDSIVQVRPSMGELTVKSFSQFAADVLRLQSSLCKLGLKPRQLVALHADHCYEFLVWDVALVSLGAIPHVLLEGTTLPELRAKTAGGNFACVVSKHLRTMTLPQEGDDQTFASLVPVNSEAPICNDLELLTRVHSSGTTGQLKGLEISRCGAEALASQFIEAFEVTAADRHLIFLPLSHFQQRLSVYVCLWAGTSFALTPFTHVFHDLPRFAPTFLIGPPAFYENLLAVHSAWHEGAEARTRLVAGVGKHIRFMITGMAPVRRVVLDTFAKHGLVLLEAYGMTEVGLISWNVPGDNKIGTAGRPLRVNEVLVGSDSEILVRSRAPLTMRYFDVSEEESRWTFRDDGWIATGDIGAVDDGCVVLHGRKKDAIVTSGGQKFHPMEVERLLLECSEVKQAAVVCAGQRQEVIAVLSVADTEDPSILEVLKKHLAAVNRSLDMHRSVTRFVLTTVRFSAENGLLTRNLKPNRNAIALQFGELIVGEDRSTGLALETI